MDYDEYGYICHRPITADRWPAAFPGMPPGRYVANHTIPPGMLVIENFLDPKWCDALLGECSRAPGAPHAVGRDDPNDMNISVASDIRQSEHIDIHELKSDVVGVTRQVFQNVVAPHYQAQIEWFERPEILRYRSNGKYVPHADCENWDAEERRWKRMIDRDLSILMYLNDAFKGGEVKFLNFDFTLKPRRGLLIAFPSDHRYLHAVETVTAGVRYAIASWAAIKGGPRVQAEPHPTAIRL